MPCGVFSEIYRSVMKKDGYINAPAWRYTKKKVLNGGVHHRNYESRFLFFLPSRLKTTFRERTSEGLDRLQSLIETDSGKMTEDNDEVKCDTICDEDKSIKSKQCNKFSIENILGLNNDTKVNRLELMDLCQKGKSDHSKYQFPPPLNRAVKF